jgi:hypothetical protein
LRHESAQASNNKNPPSRDTSSGMDGDGNEEKSIRQLEEHVVSSI